MPNSTHFPIRFALFGHFSRKTIADVSEVVEDTKIEVEVLTKSVKVLDRKVSKMGARMSSFDEKLACFEAKILMCREEQQGYVTEFDQKQAAQGTVIDEFLIEVSSRPPTPSFGLATTPVPVLANASSARSDDDASSAPASMALASSDRWDISQVCSATGRGYGSRSRSRPGYASSARSDDDDEDDDASMALASSDRWDISQVCSATGRGYGSRSRSRPGYASSARSDDDDDDDDASSAPVSSTPASCAPFLASETNKSGDFFRLR